jgi:hypothetical protein
MTPQAQDEIYREIFNHFSCTMRNKGTNPLKTAFEPYQWYITHMIPNQRITSYFSQQDTVSPFDEIKHVQKKIQQLENDLRFEKHKYNNLIKLLIPKTH